MEEVINNKMLRCTNKVLIVDSDKYIEKGKYALLV